MDGLSRGPVKGPQFRGRSDAASEGLFDVDVLYILAILVMFYMESNSGVADDSPCCPTDALQGQDFIGIITEFMVLRMIDQMSFLSRPFVFKLAWTNFPLRLRVVTVSGAAILRMGYSEEEGGCGGGGG